jgi:hypothetical protein
MGEVEVAENLDLIACGGHVGLLSANRIPLHNLRKAVST